MKSIRSYIAGLKTSVLAGLAIAFLACAPAAFANNGQGNGAGGVAGGYIAVGGGYNLTDYSGTVKGSSSSDAAGGGMAGTGVNGTGYSTQANIGGVQTSSYANGTVGAGYVTTNTGGSSSEYNTSTGTTYGSATGQSQGQAGGDYSSKASGKFNANYTGVQGNLWIGGVIAGGYETYHY